MCVPGPCALTAGHAAEPASDSIALRMLFAWLSSGCFCLWFPGWSPAPQSWTAASSASLPGLAGVVGSGVCWRVNAVVARLGHHGFRVLKAYPAHPPL